MKVGPEPAHVPEHILAEANDLMEWLRVTTENLPLPPTNRARAAAACFVVVHEHHDSILLLSEHQLFASVFALVRVAFDAYVRGVWLSICASDSEVEGFIALKEPPKTHELVVAIDAHPDYVAGLLPMFKKQNYKWMCDFTHTGGRQIRRWTDLGGVEPNYPLGQVLEVIATSESVAILALFGVIGLVEDEEIVQDAAQRVGLVQDRVLNLHAEQRAAYPQI